MTSLQSRHATALSPHHVLAPAKPRRVLATRRAPWARRLAARLARLGVQPNTVSIAGVVFAVSASVAFWSAGQLTDGPRVALLMTAAVSVQLRLLCNLLDGMLAIEEGFKSRTGDVYNEIPDRISDIVILAGAGYAMADGAAVTLGWSAAVMAVFTAYVRVFGGSLGLTQHFGGPMAKQHRMFALTVATMCAAGETVLGLPSHALSIGLALIIVGSVVTAARRTRRIVSEVNAR